jgi:hypothetical protein
MQESRKGREAGWCDGHGAREGRKAARMAPQEVLFFSFPGFLVSLSNQIFLEWPEEFFMDKESRKAGKEGMLDGGLDIVREREGTRRRWLLRKSSSSLFLDSWFPGFLIKSSR